MQAKTAKFPIKWELAGFGKLNIQKITALCAFIHRHDNFVAVFLWQVFTIFYLNLVFLWQEQEMNLYFPLDLYRIAEYFFYFNERK